MGASLLFCSLVLKAGERATCCHCLRSQGAECGQECDTEQVSGPVCLLCAVRSEEPLFHPGLEATGMPELAGRCPLGAPSWACPPPHLAASREVILRVWVAPLTMSLAGGGGDGGRLSEGWVIWRRQESSGALPGFPQSRTELLCLSPALHSACLGESERSRGRPARGWGTEADTEPWASRQQCGLCVCVSACLLGETERERES